MSEPQATPVADEFPVDSFREAVRHLRRPFTPAAIKFKVQAVWPKDNPTGGLIVSYIDQRLATERLNLVCPHLWHDAYEPTAKGLMWCHLTVDGITRSDVGEGQGKGLVSDALKRAAVKFGVGVSLYATPSMRLSSEDGALKQRRTRDGLTLELTPKGEQLVRGMYEHWLDAHGRKAFGEPLDHGDVEGAQGDHEADDTPPTVDAPPALDAEIADELEALARAAFEQKHMTGEELSATLKVAGATRTESVRAAIESLTPDGADSLRQNLLSVFPGEQKAAA